jgi:hypothetical protein
MNMQSTVFSLVLIATTSGAATWKQGQGTLMYDVDSVRRDGRYVFAWIKSPVGGPTPLYSNGKYIRTDNIPMGEAWSFIKFDCVEKTSQQLEIKLYQKGILVFSDNVEQPSERLVPESSQTALSLKICKKKWEFWR